MHHVGCVTGHSNPFIWTSLSFTRIDLAECESTLVAAADTPYKISHVAVTTIDECNLAARLLGLSDTTAADDGHTEGVNFDPPFCCASVSILRPVHASLSCSSHPEVAACSADWEQELTGGQLYFNSGGANTGGCTQRDRCLCAGAAPPPPPKAPPPSPSPPPPVPHPPWPPVNPPGTELPYSLWRASQCTNWVTTIEECNLAATILRLPDTTATDDGQANGVDFDPPYCYWEQGQLYFNPGGVNSGGCTNRDRCICVGAGPPLPPPPPAPFPPGGWGDSGGGYLIYTGSGPCANPVGSIQECAIAAAAVSLIDTTPRNDRQGAESGRRANDPPYCYVENLQLKWNGGTNTGDCSGSGAWLGRDRCICRAPAPSPPPGTTASSPSSSPSISPLLVSAAPSPLSAYAASVSFTVTISDDSNTFDTVAYAHGVARLAGVTRSAVSVAMAMGSMQLRRLEQGGSFTVTATVATATEELAAEISTTISSYSAARLGIALNVSITAVTAPVVVTAIASPPPLGGPPTLAPPTSVNCCMAVEARCLACTAQMSIYAYCAQEPDTPGCSSGNSTVAPPSSSNSTTDSLDLAAGGAQALSDQDAPAGVEVVVVPICVLAVLALALVAYYVCRRRCRGAPGPKELALPNMMPSIKTTSTTVITSPVGVVASPVPSTMVPAKVHTDVAIDYDMVSATELTAAPDFDDSKI